MRYQPQLRDVQSPKKGTQVKHILNTFQMSILCFQNKLSLMRKNCIYLFLLLFFNVFQEDECQQ